MDEQTLKRYKGNNPDQNDSNSIGFEYVFYKCQQTRIETDENGENENISLSLFVSSLNTALENDLRQFICRRFSKGSICEGQGNISAVVIGGTGEEDSCVDCLCYYISLTKEKDELGCLLSNDSKQAQDEYIVCLLTANDVMLDLFRPELDLFSRNLMSLMESDLVFELELRAELGQLDGFDNRLQNALSSWFLDATQYLCRCLSVLGEDIKHVLYCALTDTPLDIQCSDEKLKSDIQRFTQCCSLSELLNSMKHIDPQHSDSSCSETGAILIRDVTAMTTESKLKSSLVIDNNGYRFHNCGCTDLCVEWTTSMLMGDRQNPAYVKQIIESYKLRVIHDMNNLKRMLKQAESDYYALYRCYNFLVHCGNESILLRHATHETSTTGQKDTLSVLTVINQFVSENRATAS